VKEEDGVYTVSVQVEPSNVFQTLQQSSTEVSNEKIITVKVSVEKDNSGKYGLSDTEMNKLEAAMFPTE